MNVIGSTPDAHARAPRSTPVLVCSGAVALLAGLVYANALHNPFVFDDHRMIVENTSIHSLTNLRAVLLHEMTRPVVNLSYAVDYAIWGGGPFGFHLTNVLLHVVNVMLLFLVAWHLAGDRRWRPDQELAARIQPLVVALTASALLAVHPMMTQATGYISGRPEVLCGTLFLSAFLCARRWMLGDGTKWWLAAAGLWVLALATKEVAVMFPFVLLCYDRFVLAPNGAAAQNDRQRLLKLHLPLIALTIAAATLRLSILTLVEHPNETVVRWQYALVELDVIRRYLVLMLLPSGQTIFHVISPIRSAFEPRAVIAIATLAAMLLLAWRLRRTDGLFALGIFWFVLLLIPSSALVVLDRGEPMAEHRVYIGAMGLFLTTGAIAGWLKALMSTAGSRGRVLIPLTGIVLLVSFGGRTLLRNAVWSSPVGLWVEAASSAPDHWVPRLLLGEALQEAGRREEAVDQYRTAIALRPKEQFAYAKLGTCLVELGRLQEAADTFTRLQDLDPESTVAPTGLGTIAMLQGDVRRARDYFLTALERDRSNVPARQLLASMVESEDPSEALRLCEEVRQIAPEAHGNDDCIRRTRARVGGAARE
jgi:Flp pilus assembly protein TadD